MPPWEWRKSGIQDLEAFVSVARDGKEWISLHALKR